jgi:hypothetical protein
VVEGQSWKRQSCGGPIVLGETVLWWRDGLGKDGPVLEGRSWQIRSRGGQIVLGNAVLWWRDSLGKDGLVGDE